MDNETTKSYNPFRMWGSWVGFGLGILIIPLEDQVFILNPISWLILLVGDDYDSAILIGLIAIFTLPIVLFIYGWGVHSFFRKINREKLAYILPVILLIVASPITYAYIKAQQVFQTALNSASVDIHSQNETVAMNAVTVSAQAETNIPILIDKMLLIANDKSLLINVRLTALESLASRVDTMTPDQKKILSDQLAVFDTSGLSDMNKERITGRITALQNLLAE